MACGERLLESGPCFAFYPHNIEKGGGGASKRAIVPTILSRIVVLLRAGITLVISLSDVCAVRRCSGAD